MLNIEEGEFVDQGNKNCGKNKKKLVVDLARFFVEQLSNFYAGLAALGIVGVIGIIFFRKRSFSSYFLISSHDLTQVTEICDRIVLLEKGKIINDLRDTSAMLAELYAYFTG